MISFPLYYIALPFLLFFGIWAFFAIANIAHAMHYGYISYYSYFMTFLFLAGIALILFGAYTELSAIDWQEAVTF